MMKIAVTGSTGYIGSRLMQRIAKYSDIVGIGLSRSSADDTFQTDYSIDSLSNLLIDVDVVVHLAANRFGSTIGDFIDNMIITENLLRGMKNAGARRIIYLSSISIYSDEGKIPWEEKQQPVPATDYGISKLACEHLCILYSEKYGIPFTIFRVAHVYGSDMTGCYMLPLFISQAYGGQQLTVNCLSRARREFVFIDDVVDAILWRLYWDQSGSDVFNLGTGIGFTNYEVADMVNRAFGNNRPIAYFENKDEMITSSIMSIEKLHRSGFSTKYSFQQGLDLIAKDMINKRIGK